MLARTCSSKERFGPQPKRVWLIPTGQSESFKSKGAIEKAELWLRITADDQGSAEAKIGLVDLMIATESLTTEAKELVLAAVESESFRRSTNSLGRICKPK